MLPVRKAAAYSYTIPIHEPTRFMAQFRDRKPAILKEQDFDGWLKGTGGKEALLPAQKNVLRERLVSRLVNKALKLDEPYDDDAGLVEPA